MKKRLQGLIVGVLIGATVTGGVVFATTGTKTIEVFYNNIKVLCLFQVELFKFDYVYFGFSVKVF